MPFSRECAEDRRVQPGSSSWWGVLLEPNTDPATLESHPFKCALLCGHTYTLQGANATKVANHVSGEGGGIRACSRATAEDKVLVTDKRRTPVQSSERRWMDDRRRRRQDDSKARAYASPKSSPFSVFYVRNFTCRNSALRGPRKGPSPAT